MTQRDDDLALLHQAIATLEDDERKLSPAAREAFPEMFERLTTPKNESLAATIWKQHELTPAQRSWIRRELHVPEYENLVSKGLVPRGREVPSMVWSLPKRPPTRRS